MKIFLRSEWMHANSTASLFSNNRKDWLDILLLAHPSQIVLYSEIVIPEGTLMTLS